MLFQLMDNKKDCAGVYLSTGFKFGSIPNNLTKTWSWSPHLEDRDIDYAQLWASGRSINDVCPPHLKGKWDEVQNGLKSHFKAFMTSKIDLEDVCFYDVVPLKTLQHYFNCKNEITEWVFDNVERPKNYTFIKQTFENLRSLSTKKLKVDLLALHDEGEEDNKAKHLYQQFEGKEIMIDYDIFGTITGRLTTKKNSFPILNLKTELKRHVYPTNDVFVEFDFNAAEVRTLLALQNIQQPEEDIHEWNIKNIFKREMSREEAKQKLFAWLYNPESNSINSDVYDRESILKRHFNDGKVETPFGRTITASDAKALNYLLQSSSSDNTIDRFNKINKFLKGSRSHVAFIVHDSIVIDLHADDKRLIPKIKQIFEDTKLGKFKTNISIGKNLGNMKKFKW